MGHAGPVRVHAAGDLPPELTAQAHRGTAPPGNAYRNPYNRAMPQARLAFCTCPDAATASRIADALVGERLAACVTVLPAVQSVYRWQGGIERADEVQLLVKTTAARMPALVERIVALHPYELPEVVAVEAAAGLPAYLEWISEQVAPDAGGREP